VTLVRHHFRIDVSAALPDGATDERVELAATAAFDPDVLKADPAILLAIPGGTYHRRYWDLQPPGRNGYSQAEWVAARGDVLIACDYLGGGDSTRPADGDFMTLEVSADAAHEFYGQVHTLLTKGELHEQLPPLAGPTYVGLGQSLGGHITVMQQGKYADYAGIGAFGVSPTLIANIPNHRRLDGLSSEQRRAAIMADNARTAGVTPVFLAFGDSDVAADPRQEPANYPASRHITLVVMPKMTHMHNFADTREQLWESLDRWLHLVRR
jgi:hypothetical protein